MPGKSFLGYYDLGCDVNDDDYSPVAKNALVLMVVALKESWKVSTEILPITCKSVKFIMIVKKEPQNCKKVILR